MQKADLKSDYLAQAPALRSLYAHSFPCTDYQPLFAQRADFSAHHRDVLVQELRQQNQGLPENNAVQAAIKRLAEPATYTVTTGHQLCLMGGPMYTIYKIATTIRLAAAIQARHPEVQVVPIFWMATEDHDWEEINHFWADFETKITYLGAFHGPVGRHVLEASIAEIWPEGISEALKAHFKPGKVYAEAFRAFIHDLFGAHGLVIIDADRPALKGLFEAEMLAEVEGKGMHSHILTQNEKLETSGYKRQIHPREVNLFYMGDGGRSLIVPNEEGGFTTKDGQHNWSLADLNAEITAHPADFSPNVAMRPLYQEKILPNLAYIGGWAEVSYWIQLRQAFQNAEIPFPLLVPRLSAALVREKEALEIQSLGLTVEDINLPIHQLQDKYLAQDFDEAPLNTAISDIFFAYDNLAAQLSEIDPTLATSIQAERAKTESRLKNIPKKVRKALRNQNPQPYKQIRDLKSNIQPDNKQQQRTLNLSAFSDIPYRELVNLILDQCEPEKYSDKWITIS
ncbi:MAG: bacillithiol biosynthesis cysteine-adding enzyme BshC [Bacteroidota bacterium]